MPSKYQEYRQMADTAERQLTSSYKSWTQFLRTAARLYKYPYNEQVMIHAQRPDATACAEYDFWNKKMGRFVRRGSTGIALIDTSGQKPQLRYVFDVADTGEREHSRPVHLWQFRAEHEDAIAATLERSYDVSGSNGIVEQMESAAAQLVKEYWVDNKRDILYNIDDSYLDGYDEFNTEVQFRNAAKASITYMLMSRCGLEPEAYMEPEDFIRMLVEKLNVKCIVAGEDFHFGHNRRGDYQMLKRYAPVYGYEALILSKMKEDERDISSTFVREEIMAGNIEKANHLLGYRYFVTGMVKHGNQIGRTIGIPTINLIPPEEKLLPPFGVYVTEVFIDDKRYYGVTNVGCKPTIKGNNPVGVETHLLDFREDVYEKVVTVEFLTMIREERRFDSIEKLQEQMMNDIAFTRTFFAKMK